MKKALIVIAAVCVLAAVYFLPPAAKGWDSLELHSMLPRPKSTEFEIIKDSKDALSIAISQSSLQEFDAYKAACIAIGYDADPEETPITYAANGPDAYFLELAISKDVFYIHLTARK